MKDIVTTFVFALLLLIPFGISFASSSPDGASAYIISPADGATVGQDVTVRFGLMGMGVAPAGIDKKNTGHHHLMIDGNSMPMSGKAMGKEVKHFGGGQTETMVNLSKGKHTLQLMLGNHKHMPHNPPVASEKITINVK